MWRGHGLPEEDGVFDDAPSGPAQGLRIAVVAYPRISNLDEFQPLRQVDGVRLVWARDPRELEGADWIILPGSKHTSGDLAWLRERGLDAAIARHAGQGRPVLGVCGGLQMLGDALADPHGVDGAATGLGLLPLSTQFDQRKSLRTGAMRFTTTTSCWSALAGVAWQGYEIHHGRSLPVSTPALPGAVLRNDAGEPIGWQRGSVLGLYAHGLFESAAVLQALFGAKTPTLDSVFDGLADFVDRHFEPGSLAQLIGG